MDIPEQRERVAKMRLMLDGLTDQERVAIAAIFLADTAMESSVQGQGLFPDQKKEKVKALATHLTMALFGFFRKKDDSSLTRNN